MSMEAYSIEAGGKGNIQFQPNTSIAVIGATGTGKTWFVYRFLKHLDDMFVGERVSKVVYRYGVYQKLFDEMKQIIPGITFQQGLPDREEIERLEGGLLILDDLMSEVSNSRVIQDLFCQICHHKGVSVIYLSQNMFQGGKCSRSIALNTQVLVLMRNMRNMSQIQYLANQIFPGRARMLQEMYEDAANVPYGYLVIDMSPGAVDMLRMRTLIFPGEHTVVYVPKGS